MLKKLIRKIGIKIEPFLLKPSTRYRFVLPATKIITADHDEVLLDKAWRFVAHSKMEGDYLEFGVWKGRSFIKAYHLWWSLFGRKGKLKNTHFFAFDSFQGLPEIKNQLDQSTGEFSKGDYSFSQADFDSALSRTGVDMKKVTVVPGWFSDTLTGNKAKNININKATIIWVDCDLYESTVPVLDFITDKIQDGTILIFDDWFAFRGHSEKGEQKAFREWLSRNPNIHATEWQKVNWKTNSFILNINE